MPLENGPDDAGRSVPGALVVLSRADWAQRASSFVYGMPYFSAGSLFLAGEPPGPQRLA